jgi:hypothetical protein
MSMISILVFANDDEIRQFLAAPERIDEFTSEERTSTDLGNAFTIHSGPPGEKRAFFPNEKEQA